MKNNTWDEIRIEGLEIFAHHGVLPQETKQGQMFYLDVVLYTDLHPAALTDDLTLTTNYGEVCEFLKQEMTARNDQLLETVAERIIEALLIRYPHVIGAKLTIQKPNAPLPIPFRNVCVKIERQWHQAYIGIGSNLGDRKRFITDAIDALVTHPKIRVVTTSTLRITQPFGVTDQDDFLNGVIQIETLYTPQELLEVLLHIEKQGKRERTRRWGPRTIDLDILFYDDWVIHTPSLTIPHPGVTERAFV
ncbi:MAG: 2-amino-4-hydroxy-6-hydroxymethyldihydropteridine diphosphokinase, partial [Clostridium sp.]|nr:2-amino-4-hydroxy-6-hydroxymethyldihydropteridine diphosphokinase [Clostridium sp.]